MADLIGRKDLACGLAIKYEMIWKKVRGLLQSVVLFNRFTFNKENYDVRTSSI